MTPLEYLALALTVALLYAVVRLLHPKPRVSAAARIEDYIGDSRVEMAAGSLAERLKGY